MTTTPLREIETLATVLPGAYSRILQLRERCEDGRILETLWQQFHDGRAELWGLVVEHLPETAAACRELPRSYLDYGNRVVAYEPLQPMPSADALAAECQRIRVAAMRWAETDEAVRADVLNGYEEEDFAALAVLANEPGRGCQLNEIIRGATGLGNPTAGERKSMRNRMVRLQDRGWARQPQPHGLWYITPPGLKAWAMIDAGRVHPGS